QGFLRSERSLIQTIGRAARNLHGKVIMYADVMSDSMKLAIEETNRRRKIQQEFNQKYGVEPVSVVKEIRDNISIKGEIIKEDGSLEKLTKKQIEKEIQRLEILMKQAAKDLDFEKAMELRDLIFELKASI